MTQKNAHEPENQNWMNIAESDAVNGARHSRSRLPFVAAAIALVAVGGGSLFAQTNNPGTSQVEPSSVVTAVATALLTGFADVTTEGGNPGATGVSNVITDECVVPVELIATSL